jgi:hypothetical protein
MSIYSLARRGTATTSADVTWDVAASTGPRPKIMEIGVFLGAATASLYGLNRPTALGTRTSPVALLAEDPGEPALTGIALVDCAVAWSVQPTDATESMRRIGFPATIGVGVIWTFPRGLIVDVSKSISLLNLATNSAAVDVYVACEI